MSIVRFIVTGYLSEGGYVTVVAALFEKPTKKAVYVLCCDVRLLCLANAASGLA